MKRIALIGLAPLALAACLAPPPAPEPGEPVAALTPVSGDIPLDVLRAMPPGVSTSALKTDAAGCYFVDDGSGPQPIMTTTTSGSQPFCG